MSAQSIPTNTKHVGYLVSEHARLVVPVASTYARRDQGEAACKAAAEAAYGCEITDACLLPASQHEAVREMLDYAAADSDDYQIAPLLVVEPNAAREQAAAELAAELDRAISTADGLIAVLASRGYAAAYSKGGNVWCDAPQGAGLGDLGMTWSGKRSAWWCKVDQGEAVPVSMRKQRAAAAKAPKAA